jgi:hypothetical protein
MSSKQKYQIVIGFVIVAFLYVIVAEVPDRWMQIYRSYQELQLREKAFLDPGQLAEKKLRLLEKKAMLMETLGKGKGNLEQNQTGVYEYLSTCASKHHIRFESLVPIEGAASGRLQEIGFTIHFTNDYLSSGAFINTIESGDFIARVTKVEIVSPQATGTMPNVAIEGTVYVYAGGL